MSAAKIKQDVGELKNIDEKLRALHESIRPLRERKKQLEQSILQSMQSQGGSQGLTQIKLPDVEITAVQKKVREKVKKSEKETSAIALLQQSGVKNARNTFKELQQVMKGAEKEVKKLKVTSLTAQKK